MFLTLVTLISLVLAVIMTVIAWRVSQEERRRSEARVAALAADIHEAGAGVRSDVSSLEADLPIRSRREVPITAPSGDMFVVPSSAKAGTRLATVVTIGLLVFGSAAAVAVVFGRSSGHDLAPAGVNGQSAKAAAQAPTPNPPAAVPLELLALGHDRDGDRLTVRGIVRNPAVGPAVHRLTAVVFLFKDDGGFVGSGRADIASPSLVPGGESAFIVTVAGATDVARYRVSFRTDDRVVPHVDRRDHGQQPVVKLQRGTEGGEAPR
jgi:flagellar basal body-associated protein FliL